MTSSSSFICLHKWYINSCNEQFGEQDVQGSVHRARTTASYQNDPLEICEETTFQKKEVGGSLYNPGSGSWLVWSFHVCIIYGQLGLSIGAAGIGMSSPQPVPVGLHTFELGKLMFISRPTEGRRLTWPEHKALYKILSLQGQKVSNGSCKIDSLQSCNWSGCASDRDLSNTSPIKLQCNVGPSVRQAGQKTILVVWFLYPVSWV